MELVYRALSVKQPWANLIAQGTKTLEVRTRPLSYRGELLIVAGQQADKLGWLPSGFAAHQAPALPRGVAICLVELFHCRPMTPQDEAAAGCPYAPGLWVYCLKNARPVHPEPVKGSLGLMRVKLSLQKK